MMRDSYWSITGVIIKGLQSNIHSWLSVAVDTHNHWFDSVNIIKTTFMLLWHGWGIPSAGWHGQCRGGEYITTLKNPSYSIKQRCAKASTCVKMYIFLRRAISLGGWCTLLWILCFEFYHAKVNQANYFSKRNHNEIFWVFHAEMKANTPEEITHSVEPTC